MTDLDRLGGVPIVMKELLSAGLLHGDCLTVTGQTVEANLEWVPTVAELPIQQNVLRPVASPLSPPGRHMVVLTGNLAAESAVIKLSGKVGRFLWGVGCVCVCVWVGWIDPTDAHGPIEAGCGSLASQTTNDRNTNTTIKQEVPFFRGPAICYDSEQAAFHGIMTGQVRSVGEALWALS